MPPWLVTLLVLVAAALTSAEPAEAVRFVYTPAAQGTCAGTPNLPALERELHERLPELETLWREAGPGLVRAVSTLTGRAFSPAGPVHLTLCEVPSNSFAGATVNMRFAMRSFTASPVPLRYKMDVAFHEMLHPFVSRYTPRRSPLLATHASESACVRNHLHLLALQKAALIQAGDDGLLEQVIAIDSALPSPCYERAWAIVNGSRDDYRAFVSELAQ